MATSRTDNASSATASAPPMRAWHKFPSVWIAGVLCLLAWGRLTLTTVTRSSPPREVQFFGAGGEPLSASEWSCHGSAYVVAKYIWRRCGLRRGQGASVAQWARFDLARSRADLLWPAQGSADRGSGMGIGAVALDSAEGGLLIAGVMGGVAILQPGGGIRWIDRDRTAFSPCLRRVGGDVDLVYMTGTTLRRSTWSEAKGWFAQSFPAPNFGPDTVAPWAAERDAATHQYRPLGCFWSRDGSSPGWRGVWLRFPLRARGDAAVPLEFWSGGPGVPIRKIATHFETPGSMADTKRGAMLHKTPYGLVLVQPGALDRTSGGGVLRSAARFRLTPTATDFVRLPGLSGVAPSHDVDYVVTPRGLEVIDYADRWRARISGQWYGAQPASELAFARLGDDASSPRGVVAAPAIHAFWAFDFKLLPDGQGGFWIMGSLGEVFVHLDSTLRRTDHLGFLERLGRALRTDRAKRNSDFYLEGAWFTKGLFLWVLFAAPLFAFALVIVAWFRPRRAASAALVLAWIYTGTCVLAVPVSFWKLSGVFW